MTGIPKYLLIIAAAAICMPVCNPSAWAQVTPKQSSRKSQKPRPRKDPAPPAPDPVQPPAPLTPAQLPAVAPQVSYQNGKLTIVAQNSTLGDVLRAVSQQTGAQIEIPANATDRVVAHIGPGAARDVLASLLNGSHFDYVMTGSLQNPAELQHVLLMPKSSAPETQPVTQANAAPQPQTEPEPPQPEPEAASDDFSQDFSGQDAQDQPLQDEGQQDQQQADQQQADQQQPGTFNGQPNIKSPEQLLQELQQRQQQLQQQQQQQGAPQGVPTPAAPNGFPIPPGAQPPQQPPPQPPQ